MGEGHCICNEFSLVTLLFAFCHTKHQSANHLSFKGQGCNILRFWKETVTSVGCILDYNGPLSHPTFIWGWWRRRWSVGSACSLHVLPVSKWTLHGPESFASSVVVFFVEKEPMLLKFGWLMDCGPIERNCARGTQVKANESRGFSSGLTCDLTCIRRVVWAVAQWERFQHFGDIYLNILVQVLLYWFLIFAHLLLDWRLVRTSER